MIVALENLAAVVGATPLEVRAFLVDKTLAATPLP